MPAKPVDLRRRCAHCGACIGHRRASAVFCNAICKQRAYRRRRAGLAEWQFNFTYGLRGRVSMADETQAERERRESREFGRAVQTALRMVGPGGGTVIVDGHTVTVVDLRSLGLRRTSD